MIVNNLIFSLNATVPLFLIMVLGWVLYQIKFIDDHFVSQVNKFVFNVALPVLMFRDLAKVDVRGIFDGKYVLFCIGATLVSILLIWALAKWLMKDKNLVGEFVQGSYRSSAAILGAAFIQNIYGSSGMSGLMVIGCVPLYNIFAVIILVLESPQNQQNGTLKNGIKKSLTGILTNPIIIGVVAGFLGGLIRIPLPPIADKTLGSIACLTSPLALFAIGAGFKGKKALANIKLTAIASFIKLMLLPALLLPFAVWLGFRDQSIVALIVMLGSITTPSSYIMAKQMGHEGSLTASICVATTVMSAITLTFWLFLAKSLGWIA